MWINHLFDTARFAARVFWQRRVGRMQPNQIAALQQRRLRRLVAWAAARSPFYAARYRGLDPARFELSELPPVTKAEMMEHFDSVPTDRRLRRADLEEFTADPARLGQWYLGRYAASRTSGTQGTPALVVQDRRAVGFYFVLQAARGSTVRSDPAQRWGGWCGGRGWRSSPSAAASTPAPRRCPTPRPACAA